MKKKTRRMIKKSIKYFIWLLMAVIGIVIWRFMSMLSDKQFIWVGLGIVGLFSILVLWDILDNHDLLPFFKN